MVAQGVFADVAQAPDFQALLDRRDIGTVLAAGVLHSAQKDPVQGYWLRADQVLLATECPRAISARNIQEGRIVVLRTESEDAVLVQLATPAGPLLARVTGEAVRELGLAPGKPAWALVKAHAV